MSRLISGTSAFRAPLLIAALLVASLVALVPGVTSAHEHREVGAYTMVVGFVNEPAVQGDTNGLVLEVTKGKTAVTGLADTLKAQVIFGDQTRDLTLTPVWNTDGSYESFFIPTQPGDYTFRIYGTVEGVDVDETFTSSPEGFDSVTARADLEFPKSEDSGSSDTGTTRAAMPLVAGLGALAAVGAGVVLRRRSV